tara:strand:- start:168 stop:545 length:378 start_codon:yes stop_codon:yes gene_type:complete
MISKNLKSSALEIAKEFREKKEEGLYSTYIDAYKAAVTSSKIDGLSVKKLERAYYQSIRKDKITKNQNSKSVSIPIMITQEMRMRLKGLKYHMSDIRNLTPQEANDIIRNQIINKNMSINHARNQ